MEVAISIPIFSNPPACLLGHLELIYVDFYKDQKLANRATTDSPFRWGRNAHVPMFTDQDSVVTGKFIRGI